MVTWGSRGDQAALGPAFDVRDFHHALLKGGTLPLHMLRDQLSELCRDRMMMMMMDVHDHGHDHDDDGDHDQEEEEEDADDEDG
eukprot:942896-Rhodomonas_salina.2